MEEGRDVDREGVDVAEHLVCSWKAIYRSRGLQLAPGSQIDRQIGIWIDRQVDR